MRVVTYDIKSVRPELPVPLAPAGGLAEFAGRWLSGLRGPAFSRARRANAAWAAVAAALGLAGTLLPGPWRVALVGCATTLALVLLVRAVALVAFERRQRDFEPRWLDAQSELLRRHTFEVVRFRLHEPDGRRTYDLDDPRDVDELLARQERERSSGGAGSRAGVQFLYRAGGTEGGIEGVAEVVRDLAELRLLPGRAGRGWAWIRFPEARYLRRPGARPAQRVYWTLSGPAEVAVAGSPAGAGSGAAAVPGSTGRAR
ncbi:hypothetical protein MF672_000690 [Actinomadura sp. ATCC 31491]|uniref:Uncharacterized protein n=1 Tax=Actinomadura luzonensis TaxID=2805427 RepID=A0ABT0FJ47_9ACTN|nr:hypothetical protein [Actinomadura luzonensis]MCK2212321.1 hypothetical protein [Actinomadura luzonensis]